MSNGEDIRRYTSEQLGEMCARGESQTDWERVRAMTDEDVERAIAEDPDAQGAPDDAWSIVRGSDGEERMILSLALNLDVLRWFAKQESVEGSVNAALREYMKAHTEPV